MLYTEEMVAVEIQFSAITGINYILECIKWNYLKKYFTICLVHFLGTSVKASHSARHRVTVDHSVFLG